MPNAARIHAIMDADLADDDRLDHATALASEGRARHSRGDVRGALAKFNEALATGRTILDTAKRQRAELPAMRGLGVAHGELGQLEDAVEAHETVLALTRATGNRWGEGVALAHLGDAQLRLDMQEKAVESHEAAVAVARASGDREAESARLGGLGAVCRALGFHDKAAAAYEAALALKRGAGDQRSEGTRLLNLGRAYLAAEPADARAASERLREAARVADGVWARLCSDDERVAFGDERQVASISRYLQRALVRLVTDHYDEVVAAASAKNKSRRERIDDATATRIQQKLKGAGNKTPIGKLLKKYDKSGDGKLDKRELAQLIRKDLKVPKSEVSDAEISSLVAALDDDGGGELDIAEIADFVRRGTETFVDPPRETRYLSRLLAPPQFSAPAVACVQEALEVAEASRARALDVLRAQQAALAKHRRPFHPHHPHAGAAPVAARGGERSFAELAEIARARNACVVVYSLLFGDELLIWVLSSRGALAAFEQVPLEANDNELAVLVEATRRAAGAEPRHARGGPLIFSPDDDLAAGIMRKSGPPDDISPLQLEGGPRRDSPMKQHEAPFAELARRCHDVLIAPVAAHLEERLVVVPDQQLFALPFALLHDGESFLVSSARVGDEDEAPLSLSSQARPSSSSATPSASRPRSARSPSSPSAAATAATARAARTARPWSCTSTTTTSSRSRRASRRSRSARRPRRRPARACSRSCAARGSRATSCGSAATSRRTASRSRRPRRRSCTSRRRALPTRTASSSRRASSPCSTPPTRSTATCASTASCASRARSSPRARARSRCRCGRRTATTTTRRPS